MPREQLVSLCSFLGMPTFAPTAVLRFQLRRRMRNLRNEDKDIMWEGVGTLQVASPELGCVRAPSVMCSVLYCPQVFRSA